MGLGLKEKYMTKEEVIEFLKKKDKRYCKGCLLDVTNSMYCSCGEFGLSNSETYSEKQMKEIDKN
jgi:hypothetical protein